MIAGTTAEESIGNFKSWLDYAILSRCCAPRVRVKLTNGQDAVGVYQRLNQAELNAIRQYLLSLHEWTRLCEDEDVTDG